MSLGIPNEKIIPSGAADNFWQMGKTGPCGPAAEIWYSQTGRWQDAFEIWNIVFIQFNMNEDGNVGRLGADAPNNVLFIDTGMGFERLCSVVQGTCSNYQTDIFSPIFSHINSIASFNRTHHRIIKPYEDSYGNDDQRGLNSAYRIIADHARMFTISISDGLIPGKKLAPNALRRIIRRSVMCWKANFHSDATSLVQLVDPVIETIGDAFPELSRNSNRVKEAVQCEIELFEKQLRNGRGVLEKLLKGVSNKAETTNVLNGQVAWILYASYGMPEDVIANLAAEKNLLIDAKGFERRKNEEAEKSRQAAGVNVRAGGT